MRSSAWGLRFVLAAWLLLVAQLAVSVAQPPPATIDWFGTTRENEYQSMVDKYESVCDEGNATPDSTLYDCTHSLWHLTAVDMDTRSKMSTCYNWYNTIVHRVLKIRTLVHYNNNNLKYADVNSYSTNWFIDSEWDVYYVNATPQFQETESAPYSYVTRFDNLQYDKEVYDGLLEELQGMRYDLKNWPSGDNNYQTVLDAYDSLQSEFETYVDDFETDIDALYWHGIHDYVDDFYEDMSVNSNRQPPDNESATEELSKLQADYDSFTVWQWFDVGTGGAWY